MRISTQKPLGWWLFTVGAAGMFWAALAILIHALHGMLDRPVVLNYFIWLAVAVCVTFAARFWLRRCYKLEPMQSKAPWHVSMADCIAATFFAALWMGVWSAFWPDEFLYWGSWVSIIAGAWFLAALMAAGVHGVRKFPEKLFMALGVLLRTVGYFSWGTLAATSIFIGWHASGRGLRSYLSEVMFDFTFNDPILWLYRAGLFGLLVGAIICRILQPKTEPSA